MTQRFGLANFSASMVAEVMMSLKSCRRPTTDRKTSVHGQACKTKRGGRLLLAEFGVAWFQWAWCRCWDIG